MNSKYALKIKEIDEQHRALFELVNNMEDAVNNCAADEILAAVLEELVDYTIYHFNMEEEFIKLKGYPKIKTHKLEHANLTHYALQFKAEFKKNRVSIIMNS